MNGLETLRAATRELHDRLEGRLVIGRDDVQAADEESYLRALLGWLEPVERSLWAEGSWPAGIDADERGTKVSWILEDLAAAGLGPQEIAALPRCTALPDLEGAGRRYGMAYVVEGSMLGGSVLAKRHAARRPGERVPRYYLGYGKRTRDLWLAFLAALEARADEPGFLDEAAETAQGAFLSLESWLSSWGVVA